MCRPDRCCWPVIRVAADFDADLAAQRATEGWRTARRTPGALPGQKPVLTPEQQDQILALAKAGLSAERLATQFGVGRSTIYRLIAKQE